MVTCLGRPVRRTVVQAYQMDHRQVLLIQGKTVQGGGGGPGEGDVTHLR